MNRERLLSNRHQSWTCARISSPLPPSKELSSRTSRLAGSFTSSSSTVPLFHFLSLQICLLLLPKMKRFLVVVFVEEGSIAVVPRNWEQGGYCFWPPVTSPNMIKKMVMSSVKPKDNWSRIKIRTLYSSDSYERAHSKLKKAEDTSDLATENSESEFSHKQKKRLFGENSDSELEIPTAPVVADAGLTFTPSRSLSGLLPVSPTTPSVGHTCNTCNKVCTSASNELFQRKVLHLLEELREEQKSLKKTVNELRIQQNVGGCPDNPLKKPADSPEELLQFNEFLENKENFIEATNFFSTIGGFHAKDTIRRILQFLMTNKLSQKYNWKGTGGIKLGFCNFQNVIKLVKTSVRNHSTLKQTTEHEIESCIKKWLMHAKDRDGGRSQRAVKAANMEL